jgi:hypothetical protein
LESPSPQADWSLIGEPIGRKLDRYGLEIPDDEYHTKDDDEYHTKDFERVVAHVRAPLRSRQRMSGEAGVA